MKATGAASAVKDSLRIGFVGAGKVGFSLGRLFSDGGMCVTGYYSRSAESAREAAAFTGSSSFESLGDVVAASDALLLTVPDKTIGEVYRQLDPFDLTGKQLCHCSGSLTAAETFPGLGERGASGYSLHPLFPVSSKLNSHRELPRAFFCIEGDPGHLLEWKRRIESLGPRVQVIDGAAKKRYHAACAISSNLVCALVDQSLDMLSDCGFTRESALEALTPLMLANMAHIVEDGPVAALTGPIERNDASVVESHLACLEDPDERELYRSASLKLVQVAKKRHPDTDYSRLEGLLRNA